MEGWLSAELAKQLGFEQPGDAAEIAAHVLSMRTPSEVAANRRSI
jgi:hypothetical protein